MYPDFQRLMSEATRLTRAGNLQAATAAIQAALRGTKPRATPAAAPDLAACVIEVEAREVAADPVFAKLQAPPSERAKPIPHAGRFIAGSYGNAAGARDYKLYVPPAYRGQALPLVVMLHGCTQNPDDFAAGTGMNQAARERGFFVLYPAQSRKANHSLCWNWFKHNHQQRERGEPAVLAGMTRDVIERYTIDARRVYVAGLSAGGAMAVILGATYPDVYAAAGVHSGLPAGAASDVRTALTAMKGGAQGRRAGAPDPPAGALPSIVFHGDADRTVHPVNGEQVTLACVGRTTPAQERGVEHGRAYTRHLYRDASGRVVAEQWLVHGAGHAWSGGSTTGSYADARGPSATREMLRFFFANPRRAVH